MISASMATVGRESLPDVVDSIIDQVDHLEIKYNGCEAFGFENPKIQETVYEFNFGDGMKFDISRQEKYHFCIDDDLIYPEDYVETYLNYLQSYDVVSSHGVRFTGQTDSYYKGANRQKFHCLLDVPNLESVHVVGTGVLAFTDAVEPRFRWCKVPNMADIWFSLACESMGVERYVIPHASGWIKHADIDLSQTIYETHKNSDEIQTQVAGYIYEISRFNSAVETS